MCKVVEVNPQESVPTSLANQSVSSINMGQNLFPLETISKDINRILSPVRTNLPIKEQPILNTKQQSHAESKINISISGSPTAHQDDHHPASMVETEMTDVVTESEPPKESSKLTESDPNADPAKAKKETPHNVQASMDPCSPGVEGTSLPNITCDDVEMNDKKNDAVSGSTEKPGPGVIVLDD